MIDLISGVILKGYANPNIHATRALDRRSHSLSQHTQFLKNNMIDENVFFYDDDFNFELLIFDFLPKHLTHVCLFDCLIVCCFDRSD